jgi:hypothetical protein
MMMFTKKENIHQMAESELAKKKKYIFILFICNGVTFLLSNWLLLVVNSNNLVSFKILVASY